MSQVHDLEVYNRARLIGYRNGECTLLARPAKGGEPFLTGGFEMTSVAAPTDNSLRNEETRRLCYYVEAKPDFGLLSAGEIPRYCDEKVSDSLTDEKKRIEEDKRRVCYLSLMAMKNQTISPEASNKQPHLCKYLSWASHQISANSSWDLQEPLDEDLASENHDEFKKLCSQIKHQDAEGKAIAVVAKNLPNVLNGQTEGLQVLFDDNSFMDNYYHYAHSSVAFSKLKYLDARVHKDPSMKILEIGAGTGGATEVLLSHLMSSSKTVLGTHRFTEYTYTDISPSFFENARSKFNFVSGKMKFATLNIEIDPRNQGFQEGQYDMIIASHVIHATKNLE